MVFFSETLGIPSLRVLAQKLLELLFDYEVEKEPLLFHVFSNAGVMLYRYVLELLQTHQRFCHLRVVGTIFDSGPGDSNLLGALRALAVVLEHRPAALRLLLLVAFTLVAFLSLVRRQGSQVSMRVARATRLEALVPSRDSRARTRSPSPRACNLILLGYHYC